MRGAVALALCLAACGRLSFDGASDATSSPSDAALTRVQVASGWTARVLVDLTGVVPYHPNDYVDDGGLETLDNSPVSLAALYAPFTSTFAVGAGRSIIEVAGNGTTAVHDYRPAVPDTTGPDEISELVFGAPPDTGPVLWLGASSMGLGDGLYRIATDWSIVQDSPTNNVNGVAYDPTGAFDSIGVPTIYFMDTNAVQRRTGAGTSTNLQASTTFEFLGMCATTLFTTDQPAGVPPTILDRIFETTYVVNAIATSSFFAVAEMSGGADTHVIALRDSTTLASYANDGTSVDLASSLDATWLWQAVSVPRAPHPLAGSYVVLESNRTLDRDDLIVISPAP